MLSTFHKGPGTALQRLGPRCAVELREAGGARPRVPSQARRMASRESDPGARHTAVGWAQERWGRAIRRPEAAHLAQPRMHHQCWIFLVPGGRQSESWPPGWDHRCLAKMERLVGEDVWASCLHIILDDFMLVDTQCREVIAWSCIFWYLEQELWFDG